MPIPRPSEPHLRVLTLNLDLNPAHLEQRFPAAVALLEDLDPDVVCLQEVLHPAGEPSTAERLAAATGVPLVAAAAHDPHPSGVINGVAVLSGLNARDRHETELPQHQAQTTQFGYQRRAAAAELVTPAGRPLLVTTAHLEWGGFMEGSRTAEAVHLDAWTADLARDRSDGITVLTGDFNCGPDSDTVRFLTGRSAHHGRGTYWVDAWEHAVTRHSGADNPHGHTSSPANPWLAQTAAIVGISRPELLPARRLDFVMVRDWVHGRAGQPLTAAVVGDRPSSPGGVLPSDHYGVLTDLWDPPLS